jgi:hypothetical protein
MELFLIKLETVDGIALFFYEKMNITRKKKVTYHFVLELLTDCNKIEIYLC